MTMATKRPAPAGFSDKEYKAIPMTPVQSNQIASVGYDTTSKTLAVIFARGPGHIYHYPGVSEKTHSDMMAAESKGAFFALHIKSLPFEKFPAQVQRLPPDSSEGGEI